MRHDSGHAPHLPGSDHRLVEGIALIDPMRQGVGAVLRTVQRGFGVTQRHCIDVQVGTSLSTEALLARHLTPADLEREEQRYHCNAPMGLHV
ncbi:hypothetical protein ACYJW8_05045 [Frateuria aurantia]